jgi:hypothetical protein
MWRQCRTNKVEDYSIMGGTSPHTLHLISTSLLVVFKQAFMVFLLVTDNDEGELYE